MAVMVLHTFLWDKVALSSRVPTGNINMLKNNFIFTMKCDHSNASLSAGLPLDKHSWILGPYLKIVPVQNNPSKLTAFEVSINNVEEVGRSIVHIPPLILMLHHVAEKLCECRSHNIIQGKPFNPAVNQQVWLKIMDVLWHACGWLVHWYVCQLRYALEQNLIAFFALHMWMYQLIMLVFEKVNHRDSRWITWLQDCTGKLKDTTVVMASPCCIPDPVFVVGIEQWHALGYVGKYGATGQMYPFSFPHRSPPASPSSICQSIPLWC